jgi:hypothetical protein
MASQVLQFEGQELIPCCDLCIGLSKTRRDEVDLFFRQPNLPHLANPGKWRMAMFGPAENYELVRTGFVAIF